MGWQSGSLALTAFEACDRLRCETDVEAAKRLLAETLKQLGHEYLTCTDMPAAGQDPRNCFILNTRPAEYCQRYNDLNHVDIDPVVTELRHTLRPYSWSDVKERRTLSRRELSIIDEGREFDMRDGLTIPVVLGGGRLMLIFPSGRTPDLGQEARAATEFISVTGLMHIQRLQAEQQRTSQSKTRLTAREREVLRWILAGKTDDEIGTILVIGSATVRQHATNAMAKLGVFRRTVAIAEALRRGEISL